MMRTYSPQDLGPLPKRDPYKANEERSIDAFRAALPKEKFQYRDDRQNDEGVDGSVELLTKSSSLNLRAQVQLKSKVSGKANADGSISVSVNVSNLNYLLNGPSPIYVLYVVETGELRVAWARDERERLNRIDPDWISQEKVTIRFVAPLTPQAVDQIYERILREGCMHREVHERLARATLGEPVHISIDPETLAVSDPSEVYDRLSTSGLSIVSAGYGSFVLEQVELLGPEAARAPRIQLVKAYALSAQGRYLGALALLQEVRLREGDLPNDDQRFATYLRDFCEYASGAINLTEYGERRQRWEDEAESGYALAHRSLELYQRALAELDPIVRKQLLSDLRRVMDEMLRHDEIPAALKLEARIELLYIEGSQLSIRSLQEMFLGRGPEDSGRREIRGALQSLEDLWPRWEEEALALTRQAVASGHPFVIASALSTHASIITERLECIERANILLGGTFSIPAQSIELAIKKAVRALNIYLRAGALDGELRCKLLIADLLVLARRDDEAREIAREVLPKVEAFGYADLKTKAEEYVAGHTLLTRCEEMKSQLEPEPDPDVGLAGWTDDEVRQFASHSPDLARRGDDWLPAIEREYRSQRDAARERINWCRHITLVAERDSYAKDPDRKCVCDRFNYTSAIAHRDWQLVISAFKRGYCAGCPDRDPKLS
ncbi:MAG TPA: DUF4365 domain-containing protein [Blastocatellia bacterium]|nr:DUF4365 domain-containing protein [Blastocatellia bacterium]